MNISSEVNPAGSELERNIIDFKDVSSKNFALHKNRWAKRGAGPTDIFINLL